MSGRAAVVQARNIFFRSASQNSEVYAHMSLNGVKIDTKAVPLQDGHAQWNEELSLCARRLHRIAALPHRRPADGRRLLYCPFRRRCHHHRRRHRRLWRRPLPLGLRSEVDNPFFETIKVAVCRAGRRKNTLAYVRIALQTVTCEADRNVGTGGSTVPAADAGTDGLDGSRLSDAGPVALQDRARWYSMERRFSRTHIAGDISLALLLVPKPQPPPQPISVDGTLACRSGARGPSSVLIGRMRAVAGAAAGDDEQDAELPAGPVVVDLPRYENVLIDEVLPCRLSELHRLLFADNSTLLTDFYRSEHYTEVKIGAWAPDGSSRKRFIEYIMPLAKGLGPKQAKVQETQTYERDDNGAHVVHVVSVTPDVPYGQSFQNVLRWVLSFERADRSRLLLTHETHFTKSTLLKGIIARSAASGTQATYAAFLKHLRAAALGHRAAAATGAAPHNEGPAPAGGATAPTVSRTDESPASRPRWSARGAVLALMVLLFIALCSAALVHLYGLQQQIRMMQQQIVALRSPASAQCASV